MNLQAPSVAQSRDASIAGDAERMRVIASHDPLALEDDPELQAIVDFAARLCGAPVSLVTLLDGETQHFLARKGTQERKTPQDVSFCAQAIKQNGLMEVQDATLDDRFATNPLVTDAPNIRYYAGQPLISEEGIPLGTLCVIDTAAHAEPLSNLQRDGLAVLAQSAMQRLSSRRAGLAAQSAIEEREERLRRMIDGVPQIAWSADAEGNFDYFNRRWVELTGAEPPRLADDWRPYVHPEDTDRVFAEWGRCFAAGEEFEVEYRLKTLAGWIWVLSLAVPVAEREGDALRWFGTITDIDEVHRAFEERDMLANELSHRIKNIFAVVIGLAALKVRKTPEHKPFADELAEVLQALSRAHEFVRPTGERVQDRLLGMLGALFAPYTSDDGSIRVRISGDDSAISARSATPLALIFHELATNSAKYGALSCPEGHVELDVRDAGEAVAMSWREVGGPPVTESGSSGFGSRLVELSVTGQLQGSWDRQFAPDGLVVSLELAKAALAD